MEFDFHVGAVLEEDINSKVTTDQEPAGHIADSKGTGCNVADRAAPLSDSEPVSTGLPSKSIFHFL